MPKDFDYKLWLQNDKLSFVGSLDVSTSELLNKPLEAEKQGLKFKIVPKDDNTILSEITGSLHKYYNKGLNNANTFTYNDVVAVFSELKQYYNVSGDATVINFEFGVNVNLDNGLTVENYLNGLLAERSYSKHVTPFTTMKESNLKLGRVVVHDKYNVKVYDKGRQLKMNVPNLLRAEIKINRQRYLEDNGIKEKGKPLTVSNLLDKEVFYKLSALLENTFDSMVYLDVKTIRFREMTATQQGKFREYKHSDYWRKITYKQRSRQLKRLNEIIEKYGNNNTKNTVKNCIANKLRIVLNKQVCQDAEVNNVMFTANNVSGENLDKGFSDIPKGIKKNVRKCFVCGSDISNKKTTAKYCCKKCSNKAASQRRKEKNKIYRIAELGIFEYLRLLILSGQNIKFKYLNKGRKRKIYTDVKRIKNTGMSYKQRRQVVRVEVSYNGKYFVLTSMRAKEFIKYSLVQDDIKISLNPVQDKIKQLLKSTIL